MYATHPLPQRTTSPVARRLHAILRYCPGYQEACESPRRVAWVISAILQQSHRDLPTGCIDAALELQEALPFFAPKHVAIPVAVSAFPNELYQAPQSWVEKAFPKLIHYNKLDRGGHFAAWEQPQLFVSEVRAGFNSLRGDKGAALNR